MANFKGKASKSVRRAMDVTFVIGNHRKFYKSDLATALRDFRKIPIILAQAVKEATPEEFLLRLKNECSYAIRMAGSQHTLTGTAKRIREFLASDGYPYMTTSTPLEHTGKMLGDALIVSQKGKEEEYEFWIGISATHYSHVGTRFTGKPYADIARMLQKDYDVLITDRMRRFLGAAGIPVSNNKMSFHHKAIPFKEAFENKSIEIVEAHLYNELPLPSILGDAAREVL